MHRAKKISCLLWFLLFAGPVYCQEGTSQLFERLSSEQTGIDFVNRVEERPGNNILESEFFYNGAGVAAGDLNGDGLPELFFTANTGPNALYLNEGDFRFRDITAKAGVGGDGSGWTAGTSMADVNGDGLLDIHVCRAGEVESESRRNRLYINNGDLTFSERAAEYGLDDTGYCTQAVFFDYDIDGDLDAYIVNYSVKRSFTGFDLQTIRDEYDPGAADRLYRNDNGSFTDVSSEAGLIQNPLGFGLSATASDLRKNGWPDLYVANDFIERDYLYMNQGDGSFSEEILARTEMTSYFSMGSDIADINNDGLSDILVVDMLPYEYARRRVFKEPDYSNYEQMAPVYHRKNMRNVLQINNGNGTFTEVGRLAGISKTDWSWAPLIADFDNDGLKDLFVTNGFPRFYTDLDYLTEVLWAKYPNENYPDDPELRYDLVRQMQQVELHNFAFQNTGDLSFREVSGEWGVNQHSVSAGAAYTDLDNNGSLDLVVSNINTPPFVFKNNARQQNGYNYLKLRLRGNGQNTYGVGAKVTITAEDGTTFYQENFPVRGYQSSVDPELLFGLGNSDQVDVEVVWPDGARHAVEDITANQTLTFARQDATGRESDQPGNDQDQLFALLDQVALGLDFNHKGSPQRDRSSAPLMPHTLTNMGPALAQGDVNGDGLGDLYVGGGRGQAGVLWIQQEDGRFSRSQISAFEEHSDHQDVDAVFFDASGNGHLDLYVVSGGNHDPTNGPLYQDRLYINDGSGNFIYVSDALPWMETSGGSVTPIEIDGDGDTDLFVGGRVITNRYPFSPRSYILQNDGGYFTDITQEVSPELSAPGMVTDSEWTDVTGDGHPELIIAGEWMPIRIFEHGSGNTLTEITGEAGLENTSGWWNVLEVADFDGDGNPDIVAGNRGLNSLIEATPEDPVIVYADDFNDDSIVDPILTQVIEGERYPVPGRDQLLRQLSEFREKFPDYRSYSTVTIDDILSSSQLDSAERLEANIFASSIFVNDGNGTFRQISLPMEAQVAPMFGMIVSDFNRDGFSDILAGGNNYGTPPDQGPVAGQGILLKGDGAFGFTPAKANDTGFIGVGEIRNLQLMSARIGSLVVAARNNDSLLLFVHRNAVQEAGR